MQKLIKVIGDLELELRSTGIFILIPCAKLEDLVKPFHKLIKTVGRTSIVLYITLRVSCFCHHSMSIEILISVFFPQELFYELHSSSFKTPN